MEECSWRAVYQDMVGGIVQIFGDVQRIVLRGAAAGK